MCSTDDSPSAIGASVAAASRNVTPTLARPAPLCPSDRRVGPTRRTAGRRSGAYNLSLLQGPPPSSLSPVRRLDREKLPRALRNPKARAAEHPANRGWQLTNWFMVRIDLGRQLFPTSRFSRAFRLTSRRHLLAQIGQTARKWPSSIWKHRRRTRPERRVFVRSSQCLRRGMHFRFYKK